MCVLAGPGLENEINREKPLVVSSTVQSELLEERGRGRQKIQSRAGNDHAQ
jgi:hypothetical protein